MECFTAPEASERKKVMIDATYLKAHRTGSRLRIKKGHAPMDAIPTFVINLIENMFATLKDWRRVATRYDRCAHTFMSAIHIAASVIFYLKK
ncbi:hypothetical protein AA103196_1254 [Ameyamaea chiangmaiensis NBRC 103196]|nr:hypothetical protein AA103196_1254 [Ameyamaea chiangmaiensis NBRC 103196]